MALKNYRAVTSGQSLGDAATIQFNWTGATLKPYAPVNLRGSRDSSGNLLIEWTRRSRIGGGMRPNSDVPLGEEREVYEVEVYSGSTLKRSMIVFPNTADAQLIGKPPSGVNANNVLSPSGTNTNYGLSAQRLTSTENGPVWVEATLADTDPGTSPSGAAFLDLVNASLSDPGGSVLESDGSFNPDFKVYLFQDTGVISLNVFENGVLKSTTFVSDASGTLRIRIELTGRDVRFYKNYSGPGSVPFYTSAKIPAFPYKIRGIAQYAGTSVSNIIIGNASQPSVMYSADQQTVDFGSTQSSVHVKIYQVSSIVGRGSYADATL